MSETKHTPGPWLTKRATFPVDGEFDYAIHAAVDGDPNVIAEAFGRSGVNTRPNAEANARLIAAAPELLVALKEALQFMTTKECVEFDLKRAKDAIAKAEGRFL